MSDMEMLKQQMEELRTHYRSVGSALVKQELKALFNSHPKLESFEFTGYIPYFNDGEPCEFGIHEDYTVVNGINPQGDDYNNNPYIERLYIGREQSPDGSGYGDNLKYDPELGAMYDDVYKVVTSLPEDIARQAFGDHFKVTVTKNAIEIEEYTEHD